MFLYLKFIDLFAVLPAIAIGLLSVGVLNLNNMRDIKSDTAVGKNTLAVKMGLSKAKKYHYTILVVSFLCLFYFLFTTNASQLRYVSLVGYLPILVHLRKVALTDKAAELDPELKKLALSTFFIAVLFFISYYYFL